MGDTHHVLIQPFHSVSQFTFFYDLCLGWIISETNFPDKSITDSRDFHLSVRIDTLVAFDALKRRCLSVF